MAALGTHGANPWPAGVDKLIRQAKTYHSNQFARVKAVNAGNRTGTGAETAGQAGILEKLPGFETIMGCPVKIDDCCFYHVKLPHFEFRYSNFEFKTFSNILFAP